MNAAVMLPHNNEYRAVYYRYRLLILALLIHIIEESYQRQTADP